MTPKSGERCQRERFEDGWPRGACGRPAKEQINGEWLCGRHAAGEKRRQKTNEKRAVEARFDAEYRDRVAVLAEKHGLDLKTVPSLYGSKFYNRGRVQLPLAELERLLGEPPQEQER